MMKNHKIFVCLWFRRQLDIQNEQDWSDRRYFAQGWALITLLRSKIMKIFPKKLQRNSENFLPPALKYDYVLLINTYGPYDMALNITFRSLSLKDGQGCTINPRFDEEIALDCSLFIVLHANCIVKLFLSKHVISFRLQNQCEQVMDHQSMIWGQFCGFFWKIFRKMIFEYLGHFHNTKMQDHKLGWHYRNEVEKITLRRVTRSKQCFYTVRTNCLKTRELELLCPNVEMNRTKTVLKIEYGIVSYALWDVTSKLRTINGFEISLIWMSI